GCAAAPAPRQGTFPCRARGERQDRVPAAPGAGLRRPPAHRRGDVALPVSRRLPAALTAGARMAVVSPASPFARGEFDAGVAEIGRLGFEPVFDESVFARTGYVAGSAALRAASFERHWADPSVSALIAVRGGYGSAHLMPLLARDRIASSPKLFVGYSDNTTLLTWLTCYR